jgi:ribosomal protein L37AE/L43A
MTEKQKKGISAKSFKARYGFGVLNKYKRIIASADKWSNCPRCNYKKLTKKSAGLWCCVKCAHQVVGAAYKLN